MLPIEKMLPEVACGILCCNECASCYYPNVCQAFSDAGRESTLHLIQLLWDGIGGLGIGTVILKALFILILGAAFWVFCELVKYIVNMFAKLAVEGLRYLAVLVRGWPEHSEEEKERQEKVWSSDNKGLR